MPRLGGVVLAVVTVAGLGCSGKTPTPTPADRDLAAAFLKQIRDGQVEAAWAGTAVEFKSFMGKAEFAKFVKQHPALKAAVEPGEVKLLADREPPLTVCTFRSTGAKPAAVTVTLCREDGAWKVGKLDVE